MDSLLVLHVFLDYLKPADGDLVGWIIVSLIFGITVAYAVFLLFYLSRTGSKRIKKPLALLSSASGEGVVLKENINHQVQESKDLRLKKQWRLFSQQLISSTDKTKVYSSVDSQHYFNTQQLYPWLSNNRFIISIPSLLVALGVFGTFLGLTIGLDGLRTDADDISVLKDGIAQLIGGASTAFKTSLWGVLTSIIANLCERSVERRAHGRSDQLNSKLSELFPLISSEQSLLHIEYYSEQSESALQMLHEKIGHELQKSVSNISGQMQEALATTLNSIMKPAIDSLVSNSQQQSSQAFAGLMDEFMGGMRQAGLRQTEEMNHAAESVSTAMQNISEQLQQVFSRLSDQQNQFLDQSSAQQNAYQQEQQALQENLTALLQQHQAQQESLQERNQQQVAETHRQHQEFVANLASRQQGLVEQLTSQQQQLQQQAEERDQARQKQVHSVVQTMGEKQADLLTELTEYSRNTAKQHHALLALHQQLGEQLQAAIQSLDSSSNHLSSSSQQLGLLSGNTRTAASELAGALGLLNTGLNQTQEANQQLAANLQKQAEQLAGLREGLHNTSEQMSKAAGLASEGFNQLETHQQSFLHSLKTELDRTLEGLTDQVANIEKQAEEWLKAYSREVSSQVSDRMGQWNTETINFANEMKNVVSTMGSLIDDIDMKKTDNHA